ncbi:MAG: tetratricopeptide repeat-containing glycosyltransferase family protein [Azospirillaceae bacterium]|nr:tetratricopeptide repeat-containing glycosyltransferase family protein [Azospirillaceae bacterium]
MTATTVRIPPSPTIPAAAAPSIRIGAVPATVSDDLYQMLLQAMSRHEAGDFATAVAGYRLIISLVPALVDAYSNLAITWFDLGHLEASLAASHQAIAIKPDHYQAFATLARTLQALNHPSAAVVAYRRSLTICNDHQPAWCNVGNLLRDTGEIEASVAACRQALRLAPGDPAALNNLGNARQAQGDADAAIALYRRVLRINPDHALANGNLGNSLRAQGHVDEAIPAYRRALARDPAAAQVHLNLAIALLHRGRFREGWAEYEWRWQVAAAPRQRLMDLQPEWTGAPLDGQTILLYGEQGFGDTLQFVRFAPLVAARGGRVILQVFAPLVRLLRRVPGVSAVSGFDAPPPPFDRHRALMSLPLLFGTDLADIPATVPYLRADATAVTAWRARLASLPGRKVGLVWAGDPRPHNPHAHLIDSRRSLHLDQFAPLAVVPGVTWVSLQKGAAAAQARAASVPLPVLDWMDEIGDFADTAALVTALDLVITADTAVAHLAGALGKPVWILSRFDGCWRWLQDRDDTPWYPTARLFRQQRAGDWTSVLNRVRDALADRVGSAALEPSGS